MKKFALLIFYMFLCGLLSLTFANVGKVTFINGAQKSGRVHAVIHYANGARDTVTSSVLHPHGTSAKTKADQLAADITAQCVGAHAASPYTSTVMIGSQLGYEMTEIEIIDGTGQKKTINPSNLNDNNVKVGIEIEGIGNCVDGMAYLSLDDCGESISISTYEKTGAQIADELATGIINCNVGSGTIIISYSLEGGIVGVIEFLNLPPESSTITFDAGGDCGFEDRVVMSSLDEFYTIPTLSEWGIIILILLILAVGMVFIYKRQVSLACAGGTSESAKQRQTFLFDKRLFAKVFGITLIAGLALLGFSYLIFGKITTADPLGTFVSAAIFAYMIQYMMLHRKQE